MPYSKAKFREARRAKTAARAAGDAASDIAGEAARRGDPTMQRKYYAIAEAAWGDAAAPHSRRKKDWAKEKIERPWSTPWVAPPKRGEVLRRRGFM